MSSRQHAGKPAGGALPGHVRAKLADLTRRVDGKDFAGVVEAARELQKALPNHPYVLKALTFGLIGMGEYDLSLPVLEKAIRLSPRDPELQNNLGISLSAVMRWDESLACFDKALAHDASDAEIWKNKGVAYSQMNRWNDAIACFAKAIEVFPGDYDEAIDQLAVALLNAGRNEEAFACFVGLAADAPDNPHYIGGLLRAGLRQCQWEDIAQKVVRLRELTSGFEHAAVAPFDALAIPGITPLEQRRIAEVHLRTRLPAAVFDAPWLAADRARPREQGRRLRIGYLSYDMKNHPVAYVIPQVLELHDRSRFEIFGYSMGPDDDSDIRHRLEKAFDHFVDISSFGVTSSAKRVVDDRIDILVDLQGWTLGDRAGLLALRPARVQASWLGYAGTLGSSRLVDYLIGDSIVIPPEHEAGYAERIQRLPNCYLPMDSSQAIGAPPTRAEAGLPEAGFVFCSLNNAYKFNPEVFDVWCRLLLQAPGSCLWLNRPFGKGADNLVREAVARGVAAERIVFASYVKSRADYLARLQLADLALDPSPYTSHSSGMDVLWAGVPMVSLLGETFAGRVGASLLSAAGLPECVTGTWDDYLQLCLDLYRQPDRLGELRRRLQANRGTAPLFDMRGFTRDLEQAYLRMYDADSAA